MDGSKSLMKSRMEQKATATAKPKLVSETGSAPRLHRNSENGNSTESKQIYENELARSMHDVHADSQRNYIRKTTIKLIHWRASWRRKAIRQKTTFHRVTQDSGSAVRILEKQNTLEITHPESMKSWDDEADGRESSIAGNGIWQCIMHAPTLGCKR